MELSKLYIVELANGEKHFFGKEIDRNYFLNMLSDSKLITCKTYEVELQ